MFNLQAAASAADLQNPMIGCFEGFRLGMGVLVHPQSGLLCGAALPFVLLQNNITCMKKCFLYP